MKLILENWNKFLTEEEELEEGPIGGALAGLGLALGLGGAPQTTDVPAPEPTHQVDTQQQQAETGKVVDNGDGTFSYTAAVQAHPGMSSMAKTQGSHQAKQALTDAGHLGPGSGNGARISQTAASGGTMHVTVTTYSLGG
tara:strand:- start:12123 stop:12542 length:420 start_codon:yes stop_codon:yes gene_type:complete